MVVIDFSLMLAAAKHTDCNKLLASAHILHEGAQTMVDVKVVDW